VGSSSSNSTGHAEDTLNSKEYSVYLVTVIVMLDIDSTEKQT